jgi:hypothetical protein
MSVTFTLTGTSSILSSKYYPPLVLDNTEYALGLINLETFNSIANVTNSNNKFYFTLINQTKGFIEIPEGSYEIDELNAFLSQELIRYVKNESLKTNHYMQQPTLLIEGNNNTLKCEIKCSLDIDFTKKDTIGSLLGFSSNTLRANKKHISDNPCKIFKVNALCVECNIVSGAYRNGKEVHVIHEFFPCVPPGYKIIETPSSVIYLPVNTKQIDEITIKITDQDGNIVNFRGEVLTVRLHLRKVK